MRLQGKVAIVTGSGSGLGRACAIMFAQEGARVAVNCRTAENGERVLDAIRSASGEAIYVKADVSVAADCERLVKETLDAFGSLDVLVNNAGINPSRTGVVETTEENWQKTQDVNLKGVFLASKHVVPVMIRQGGGAIVNVCSAAGLVGVGFAGAAYCASKGGVTQLTKQMAIDLAPHNIRVNQICPGIIETELTTGLKDRLKQDPRKWAEVEHGYLLSNFGDTNDVAYAAVYLASDESKWVTGISLPVDGGLTAH